LVECYSANFRGILSHRRTRVFQFTARSKTRGFSLLARM